ncbi:MAG: hypothetical protein ACRC46_01300 [Thermoguttaceae bacterium]
MATKRQVAFSLDDDMIERLTAAAKLRGLALAAYVRQLLFECLQRDGMLSPPAPSHSTEATGENKVT